MMQRMIRKCEIYDKDRNPNSNSSFFRLVHIQLKHDHPKNAVLPKLAT